MLAPTIYFVLGVKTVRLFQSPLRNVQGKAYSFGGRQRRLALDGSINEGVDVPLVDLERIKYFFRDAKVTAVTGQFTEQIVSDILVEAGFSSFPVAYDVIPRVKMELPNRLWTEQMDLISCELDALIHGPMSSVSSLTALCPVHCIHDDSLLTPAPFKILAVEVKSSIATLLSKISEAREFGALRQILGRTAAAQFQKVKKMARTSIGGKAAQAARNQSYPLVGPRH